MSEPNVTFAHLSSLSAEAFGEPGKRTFRIIASGGDGSAAIWLEKDQLLQLALAMNQLIAVLPESEDSASSDPAQDTIGSAEAKIEFKVGRLVLGHDAARGMFVIDAHDEESPEEAPAALRLLGARPQIRAFAEEALKVCAAGRPLCPLCGGPIDKDGHRCPRHNGHALAELSDSR